MNEASTQDILRHVCSRLRARGATNRELDSILDAADQFNSECDARIDAIQSSLGSSEFNIEQNQTIERNMQALARAKQLAIKGFDSNNDPNELFEVVKGHVKGLSEQMRSLAVGGYDDHGLSDEGDALLKYMDSFGSDEIAHCWLAK